MNYSVKKEVVKCVCCGRPTTYSQTHCQSCYERDSVRKMRSNQNYIVGIPARK